MKTQIRKLTLSGMLLAVGLLLPFITMQIPAIGKMLCPMHIPVLLAGFLLGSGPGMILGMILPIMRSFLFGMPALVPNAICMTFELMTYGIAAGFLYQKMKKSWKGIYISLIVAMLVGRIVWGLASIVVFQALGNSFTWQIFAMDGFVRAIPGIIIQLILIPIIVKNVKKMED